MMPIKNAFYVLFAGGLLGLTGCSASSESEESRIRGDAGSKMNESSDMDPGSDSDGNDESAEDANSAGDADSDGDAHSGGDDDSMGDTVPEDDTGSISDSDADSDSDTDADFDSASDADSATDGDSDSDDTEKADTATDEDGDSDDTEKEDSDDTLEESTDTETNPADSTDSNEDEVTTDLETDGTEDTLSNEDCNGIDDCGGVLSGVTWQCQTRFMYGLNYAWREFGADFGGIQYWNKPGISQAVDDFRSDLQEMKDHGVNTIRWWMFPEFRTESILFDGNNTVTGIGGDLEADIQQALALADELDLYLMLTIFSFDNFRPDREDSGLTIPGLAPMVRDGTKREALMENLVREVAKIVEVDPNKEHMIAWDLMNEPEWAVTGSGAGGDEDFDPNSELDAVTYNEMHALFDDMIAVLRAESTALITIGAAAVKWVNAWKDLDQDFYQFHMYSWIDEWWPYTNGPEAYDLTDKPAVMGEFFLGNMTYGDTNSPSFSEMVNSYYDTGWAGALGWQYFEVSIGAFAASTLDDVKTFADAHTCETAYSSNGGNTVQATPFAPAPLIRRTDETDDRPYPGRLCRRGADGRPDCSI